MKAKPFSSIIMCISSNSFKDKNTLNACIIAVQLAGHWAWKSHILRAAQQDRQTDTHPGRADIFASFFTLSIWLISVCRRFVLAGSRLRCNLLHHLICVFTLFFHSLNALCFRLAVWPRLVVVHSPELDLSRAAVFLKSVQVPEVQIKGWVNVIFYHQQT